MFYYVIDKNSGDGSVLYIRYQKYIKVVNPYKDYVIRKHPLCYKRLWL